MTAAQPQPPNPNLYQLMPPMEPEQYAALKEDIKHKGVVQPIVFDEKGNIVDGHHRFRAFSELLSEGVDVPMFERLTLDFHGDESKKIEYVLSLNAQRRHLTKDQRRELVIKLRRKPYAYTMQKIAEMLHISVATVYWDLQGLPQDIQDEIKKTPIKGADGTERPSSYITGSFSTGYAILREMQMKQVAEATKVVNAAGNVKVELVTHPPAAPVTPAPAIADAVKAVIAEKAAVTESDEQSRERMTAFAYYGGKSSQLAWLLPLLPQARHFVDVFGGSGAVLMNREPSPVETYNDLDNNVVNFFKQLRDNTVELVRLLALTPYSREERRIAYNTTEQEAAELSDVERARRFFVLARQTRSGQAQSRSGLLNSWRYTRDQIRYNMAEYVGEWQHAIDGLAAVAARFRNVQIENYPAVKVIQLFDTPDTLFYCDPPYVHDSRRHDKKTVYAFEMTDEQHRELAAVLHSVKGKVALSGYPSALYDELYADWHKFMIPTHAVSGGATGQEGQRVEVLWTNYPITAEG